MKKEKKIEKINNMVILIELINNYSGAKMGKFDYIKVVETVSKTFGAAGKGEFEANHDRKNNIDKYKITISLSDGRIMPYNINIYGTYLYLIIERKYFETNNFDKWLSLFEFELEQKMLMNIKLSFSIESSEYRIKLMF